MNSLIRRGALALTLMLTMGVVLPDSSTAQTTEFGPQRVINIPGNAKGARSVYAADLDGDGDLDALSASEWDDTIAWYENTDGHGTFEPQHVISTEADGPPNAARGPPRGRYCA